MQTINYTLTTDRPNIPGMVFLHNSDCVAPGDTRIQMLLKAFIYAPDGSRLAVYQQMPDGQLSLFHKHEYVLSVPNGSINPGTLMLQYVRENIPSRYTGCKCNVPTNHHVRCPERIQASV